MIYLLGKNINVTIFNLISHIDDPSYCVKLADNGMRESGQKPERFTIPYLQERFVRGVSRPLGNQEGRTKGAELRLQMHKPGDLS